MNFWEKIVAFMATEGEIPAIFGWYHVFCIITVITAVVLLTTFFKDCEEKTVRRIALICWIITVSFELYKQIFYVGYSVSDSSVKWDYAWYAFPFQLCSNTIYLLPFVAFMKECKAREAIINFLATFSVFGGLTVFAYPAQVFIPQVGMNVQTMVHHGIQIVMGIFLLVHRRRNFSLKSFLGAVYVFIVMCLIAIVMNETFYHFFYERLGDTFNMFYFGYHFDCTLPILSAYYSGDSKMLPYPAFLALYVIGFVLIGLIVYSVGWGIYKLALKSAKGKNNG